MAVVVAVHQLLLGEVDKAPVVSGPLDRVVALHRSHRGERPAGPASALGLHRREARPCAAGPVAPVGEEREREGPVAAAPRHGHTSVGWFIIRLVVAPEVADELRVAEVDEAVEAWRGMTSHRRSAMDLPRGLLEDAEAARLLRRVAAHVEVSKPALVEAPECILRLDVRVSELDAGGRWLHQCQQRQRHDERHADLHGVIVSRSAALSLCRLCVTLNARASSSSRQAGSMGPLPFYIAIAQRNQRAPAGGPGPRHTDQGEGDRPAPA